MLGTLALAVALSAASPAADTLDKVARETFGAGGKTRTYYLLVPARVKADEPAPLIVLLHGSGRDGRSLIEPWSWFAKEYGIILAAPDAARRDGWDMRTDGPDFLYALVEMLRVQHPVDPRRVYLFGHSAGAMHGLGAAILESEYFAAAAVHAGVLPEPLRPFLEQAPRKIPIAVWVGTNDPLFPVVGVRATVDALTRSGFPATLTEIAGHTHAYYDRSPDINKQVWQFLQTHRLNADPKFQKYELR